MNEITAGTIAYLKSTEEPVFVMGVVTEEVPSYFGHTLDALSGTMVIIKRPVANRDGIQHEVDRVHLEELQTEEAFQASKLKQKKQNLNDMLGIKMFPAEGEDGPDAKKYN